MLPTRSPSGNNVNSRRQALGFFCCAAGAPHVTPSVCSLCVCSGWPSRMSTHKPLCSPALCCPLRFPPQSAPAPTWTTTPPTPSMPRPPLNSSTHTPPPPPASLATATPPAPQQLLPPVRPPPPRPRPLSTPRSPLRVAQPQLSCTTPPSSTFSLTVCSERKGRSNSEEENLWTEDGDTPYGGFQEKRVGLLHYMIRIGCLFIA